MEKDATVGESGNTGQNNEWYKSSASGNRVERTEETEQSFTENPPKRKRGRPRKNQQPETIGITSEKVTSEEKEEKKRGRPPKNASFMSEEEANSTTEFILSMVETTMINMYGNEAAFTLMERISLTSSLPKLLTGLKISTVESAKSFLYPIMGLLAFTVYGMRVMRLAVEKRNEENPPVETVIQENEQPFSSNGTGEQWTEPTISPFMKNFTMNKSRGL